MSNRASPQGKEDLRQSAFEAASRMGPNGWCAGRTCSTAGASKQAGAAAGSASTRTSAAGIIASVLLCCFAVSAPAAGQVVTAREYYLVGHWDYDYIYPHGPYFVTSFPEELSALDAIVEAGGFRHTGEEFHVWAGPAEGRWPTCRFWSSQFGSHFFTHHADECAAVRANPAWEYEGIAFYLGLPDADGMCRDGTTILYRLFNNGLYGWILHRLTTNVATVESMLSEGWVFEGDGRTRAFACVPASGASSGG